MMFMSRHGGGRLLRAFAIVSAVLLAAGAVAVAARAETNPVAVRAASALDRQAMSAAIRKVMTIDLLRQRVARPGPQT